MRKTILGERGSGKTTRLIREAVLNDAVIVTPSEQQATSVLDAAERMGLKLKGVHGVGDFGFQRRYPSDQKYYVDEIDALLGSLFKVNIDTWTETIGKDGRIVQSLSLSGDTLLDTTATINRLTLQLEDLLLKREDDQTTISNLINVKNKYELSLANKETEIERLKNRKPKLIEWFKKLFNKKK